jgi:hypothetical protein
VSELNAELARMVGARVSVPRQGVGTVRAAAPEVRAKYEIELDGGGTCVAYGDEVAVWHDYPPSVVTSSSPESATT